MKRIANGDDEQIFQELSEIVHQSADAIIRTDKNFIITYMNPAAEELFGYQLEEVMGKTPGMFNAESDKKAQEDIYNTVSAGEVYRKVLLNQKKDGMQFYVDVKVFPLYSEEGELMGYGSSMRDIDEYMKAQKLLEKSEKKYREAFDKADFYKDLLAHDMANILNNIGISIELLGISTSEMENNELQELVNNQIERGKNLISNVRQLSKVEQKPQKLKSVNLKDLIKESVRRIKPRIQNRNVSIENSFPDYAINIQAGDLLIDAFVNILFNGIFHNESNEIKLWINILTLQQDGKEIIKIEFKDNGVGVPDEEKPGIFRKGREKKQKPSGMGIGLSLVKKIIETYNGTISIENRVKGKPEKGSNFIVIFESV